VCFCWQKKGIQSRIATHGTMLNVGTRMKWRLGDERQLRISHPAKEGKWMKAK